MTSTDTSHYWRRSSIRYSAEPRRSNAGCPPRASIGESGQGCSSDAVPTRFISRASRSRIAAACTPGPARPRTRCPCLWPFGGGASWIGRVRRGSDRVPASTRSAKSQVRWHCHLVTAHRQARSGDRRRPRVHVQRHADRGSTARLCVGEREVGNALDSETRKHLTAPSVVRRRLEELGTQVAPVADSTVSWSPPACRSWLERDFLALLKSAAMPKPELQRNIGATAFHVARVDFDFRPTR